MRESTIFLLYYVKNMLKFQENQLFLLGVERGVPVCKNRRFGLAIIYNQTPKGIDMYVDVSQGD